MCTAGKLICRGFVKMGDNVYMCILWSRVQNQGAQYLVSIINEYLTCQGKEEGLRLSGRVGGDFLGAGYSLVEERHEEMEERVFSWRT